MIYEELVKNNPKFIAALQKWFENFILKVSEDQIYSEVEEYTKSLVEATLKFNKRQLFDFFDEHDIKISVTLHGDDMWVYWNTVDKQSFTAPTRIAAETEAFMKAIQLFENEKV